MGRLDLLVADIDENGKSKGWIVADLKTGRPPTVNLNEKVSRQLRFYRDLLVENNPDHPPLHAEGWYSANQSIHRAEGPSVMEDAFKAWEGMRHSDTPFEGTPNSTACGFCEWKAWCPTWWAARRDGILPPGNVFRDEVVNIIRFDSDSGATLFERAPPVGDEGEVGRSENKFGAILRDQALSQMRQLVDSGYQGPVFLGSAKADGKVMHLGDWSEVLPWSPINKSLI